MDSLNNLHDIKFFFFYRLHIIYHKITFNIINYVVNSTIIVYSFIKQSLEKLQNISISFLKNSINFEVQGQRMQNSNQNFDLWGDSIITIIFQYFNNAFLFLPKIKNK